MSVQSVPLVSPDEKEPNKLDIRSNVISDKDLLKDCKEKKKMVRKIFLQTDRYLVALVTIHLILEKTKHSRVSISAQYPANKLKIFNQGRAN